MPAEPVTAIDLAPGFYGKLPARGDFLGRRLSRPLIEAWDAWLQEAILASRQALGSAWLEIYLTSPLWRFACAAGSCGPRALAGVMMPSVDAVGRYYPLMLGCELAADPAPLALAAATAWYEALESLALAALESGFDPAGFDRSLACEPPRPGGSRAEPGDVPSPGLQVKLPAPLDGAALAGAIGRHATARSLWWTTGSQRVAPTLLICPSMPQAAAFAALLDGQWETHGWTSAGAAAEDGAPDAHDAAAPDGAKADGAKASDDTPAWDREE